MSVREKICKLLEEKLNAIIPGTEMVEIYRKHIMAMTDERLEAWIQALENGIQDYPDMDKPAELVSMIVPNFDKKNIISVDRNLKLAEKWGHPFFERCWLTNPTTKKTTLTNRRYLTLLLPVRRQSQTLDAKISLPSDNKHVDDMTNQVTGESKGSSISYPELQMLDAQGMEKVIYEFMKIRGGDEEALRIATRDLIESGEFSQAVLDDVNSTAKVNLTLQRLLTGMHVKNNVAG